MIVRSARPHVRATLLMLTLAGSVGLAGCDLVLGLDKYSEAPAQGGAGGGASTTSSSSSDSASSSGTTSTSTSTSTATGSSSSGMLFCEPNTSMDCYTGMPATTEDVGDCRGGIATCDMNGSAYGMCVGEVVPAAVDDYPKKGDENCDGSPTSDTLWAQRFGDTNSQVAYATATDSTGNVFFTGTFSGSMQIGSKVLIASGTGSLFLAKFDPNGVPLWASQYDASGYGLAVDSAGNVFLTGGSYSAVNFGVGSVPAGLFITKFDPNGNPIWTRGCGGTNGVGNAVSVDQTGAVVVVGDFQTSANCGSGALSGAAISMIVAKFSSTGMPLWSKAFSDSGGTQSQDALSVATDSNNNVWMTGRVAGSVNFGGFAQSGGTSGNAFLAKFTPSGAHIFSNSWGDATSGQTGMVVALDPLGGPVVAVSNDGNINFGSGPLSVGTVVAKFDSAGVFVWAKLVPAIFNAGLAVDAAGEGSLVGRFGGTGDFGSGPFTATSVADGYLWHFDAQGNHIYAKQYPGVGMGDVDAPRAAAVDSAGNIFIVGQFHGSYDFGAGVLSSPSSGFDAFLMKVAH